MKIENDKYYTDVSLAKYCIDKTYEFIGIHNITEIIEPSAGSGSFSHQISKCIAYDIEPEDESIIKQDYLKLEIPYKKGRLFIGNPPFGKTMDLVKKFYKKSILEGDYISFILPIGQLNNKQSLYEFDLVYSEDLGVRLFSDKPIHCCFNIYKRPHSNKLNKRENLKLQDVLIIREDNKDYDDIQNFDVRMCYWGSGSAGKILAEHESYSAEYKIIIKNDKIRQEVIELLHNINWHKEIQPIAMLKIQKYHIYQVFKKYIKNIK